MMNGDLKYSHVNKRFQERFGREFTQRDKRTVLKLVADGKAKICVSKSKKNQYSIYCVYDDIPMIFIMGEDSTFITCMRARTS